MMRTAAHTRDTLLFACLLSVVCGLALTGCSAKHYKEKADKEVYDIIAYKRKAALDDETPFTIGQEFWDPLADLPRREQPIIPEPESASPVTVQQNARPPAIISLGKALEIALRNSRDYQSRKEDIYLAALALTAERNEYAPIFAGALSGRWTHAKPDESWSADTSFGISQTLATGGRVSLTLTNEFLRYATRSPRSRAGSTLAFELVQPLWRGAGRRIAQENLTQAERDVVYQLRSFARYHKTFAVSIVSRYYQVLQQRAVVQNEWNNYKRLILSRERAAMLAKAGRRPEFEVDQAKQDELRARDRFIRSQQTYKQRLDNLKIALALPTDAEVDADENELERLMAARIIHPELSLQDVIRQALTLRLDLMTAEDEVADAERKVEVAKNGLGPDVDLVVTGTVNSEDDTAPARLRFDKGTYAVGPDVDLPFERTSERNTYRQTLIQLDRSHRNVEELRDNIKLQVRQAWRALQEAKESYEIQRRSLALAERRVDSTTLLLRAGRASTRDLLEAQSALLEAQNSLTNVLVDHTVARLQLWRDIGTLTVDPEGRVKGQTP